MNPVFSQPVRIEGHLNELLESIPEDTLNQLLDSFAVASSYTEFSGNITRISLEDRIAAMQAQGVKLGSAKQAENLLRQRKQAPFEYGLPQVQVQHEAGQTLRVYCQEGECGELQWELHLETGEYRQGQSSLDTLPEIARHSVGNRVYAEKQLQVGRMPTGYHELSIIRTDGSRNQGMVIVSPVSSFQPAWLRAGKKVWGISAQLYTLNSPQNWGIGDFSDLSVLIRCSADKGADFILLNPLHALDIRHPDLASPYSPIDRRFLNPLYICPQWCDEYVDAEVQTWLSKHKLDTRLSSCRRSAEVNYTEVFDLKLRLFVFLFSKFRRQHLLKATEYCEEFQAFVRQGGELLQRFTAYQARCQVPQLNMKNKRQFYLYLQWQASRQLQRCQQEAGSLGMRIGLINDIAVGSVSDGFEVISNSELFSKAARIGAPPDNFSPQGQDWGMPPMCPDVMKQSRFRHFIDLLQNNMKGNGALRIDHVMSLMRLWWCVGTVNPDSTVMGGAYVYYPVDELFAILNLESTRAQCMIIGEDLGVVPPEIRRYLDESGVLSNTVFYFEKYDGWHFKQPRDFKTHALAMIANHDVPTLKAWWNKSDLQLRHRIGLIADEEKLQMEQKNRDGEKQEVLNWLSQQGLLPVGWSNTSIHEAFDIELMTAIAAACARSASVMVSIPLDDLAQLELPVNIPGTSTEYANWRRKIPIESGKLLAQDGLNQVFSALSAGRAAW